MLMFDIFIAIIMYCHIPSILSSTFICSRDLIIFCMLYIGVDFLFTILLT